MIPLREIDVMGVLVAPFALCVPIALAVTLVVLAAARRVAGLSALARSPSMELGLFVASLSGAVLLLGRV